MLGGIQGLLKLLLPDSRFFDDRRQILHLCFEIPILILEFFFSIIQTPRPICEAVQVTLQSRIVPLRLLQRNFFFSQKILQAPHLS